MSFTVTLRRPFHSPVGRSAEENSAQTPPAEPPDSETTGKRMTTGGLISHYVNRRLDCSVSSAFVEQPTHAAMVQQIGRGSVEHVAYLGVTNEQPGPLDALRPQRPELRRLRSKTKPVTLRQRLITACLVATLLLGSVGSEVSAQNRYQVRSGDTIESVAATFGVDPEAILRSSWLSNPPELTVGDVIIIPDPGQSPEEAATLAAGRVGASPWTSGVYWVEEGDSIAQIAGTIGVDAEAMLSLNGLTWSDIIYTGDRLLIPGAGTDVTIPSEPESSYSAYIWVPTHRQERSLSCEYAATFIATSAFDNPISESVFDDSIPVTANPHFGFRGDIDGSWGRYDDYGIYPEALVPILNDHGFAGDIFYSMGDTTELRAHLDAGHPVVTWLAMWGDTGRVYDDEGTYSVFAGAHVMTAYAYNDEGVYLSNPGNGSYLFMEWSTFVWMWGTIDGMSMAVYPF